MAKVDPVAVISGVFFVVLGVALLVVALFIWVFVIYAIVSLVIGIAILLTLRQQDAIEQIRTDTSKKRGGVKDA